MERNDRSGILSRIRLVLFKLELLDGKDPLEESTGLLGKGIGLDSVEIILLVSGLEEEFGLVIDDNELMPEYFQTVGTLMNFLAENYLGDKP